MNEYHHIHHHITLSVEIKQKVRLRNRVKWGCQEVGG